MATCNPLHSKQTIANGIHIGYSFEYTDATTRNAASLASTDIGKFARQTDTNEIYMLTATTPTWVLIGPSTGLTSGQHQALDQLVHNIAQTSYEEITTTDGNITDVTTYTDVTKVTPIRAEQIAYADGKVDTVTTIQYDGSGSEVERLVETYTWSGGSVTSISKVFS